MGFRAWGNSLDGIWSRLIDTILISSFETLSQPFKTKFIGRRRKYGLENFTKWDILYLTEVIGQNSPHKID